MFTRKPNDEAIELNAAITEVHLHMTEYVPNDPEYAIMADQLVKLYAQKKEIPSKHVSPDAMIAVLGNLAGILAIVMYEQRNVMTTKALSFVGKATR